MKNTMLLDSLRAQGLRITPLKKSILTILEKEEGPLSVPELQGKLKKRGLEPNKTSLYRELQSLSKIEVVEETQLFKDVRSYELRRGDEHHHHFVCQKCESIIDFDNDQLEIVLSNVARNLRRKGHRTTDHQLNLYGLCASCQ